MFQTKIGRVFSTILDVIVSETQYKAEFNHRAVQLFSLLMKYYIQTVCGFRLHSVIHDHHVDFNVFWLYTIA